MGSPGQCWTLPPGDRRRWDIPGKATCPRDGLSPPLGGLGWRSRVWDGLGRSVGVPGCEIPLGRAPGTDQLLWDALRTIPGWDLESWCWWLSPAPGVSPYPFRKHHFGLFTGFYGLFHTWHPLILGSEHTLTANAPGMARGQLPAPRLPAGWAPWTPRDTLGTLQRHPQAPWDTSEHLGTPQDTQGHPWDTLRHSQDTFRHPRIPWDTPGTCPGHPRMPWDTPGHPGTPPEHPKTPPAHLWDTPGTP